jgi:hypothetical protein
MPETALSPNDGQRFAAAFLDQYLAVSFGSMPKREIDLLVFRLLMDTESYKANFSAGRLQALSRKLRIPVSRIKALYYETQLRTVPLDDLAWLRTNLATVLRTARLKIGPGEKIQIQIAIPNPLVREELIARLESNGAIVDSSFRREILLLHCDDYFAVISAITNRTEFEEIEKGMMNALKKQPDAPKKLPTGKELFGTFLNGIANRSGEAIVDLSVGLLKSTVAGF